MPDILNAATTAAKKPGFWSKLGQGLVDSAPAFRKVFAHLANAGGNPRPLQQIQQEEEQSSALETAKLNQALLRKRVEEHEPPDAAFQRRLREEAAITRQKQELTPPETITIPGQGIYSGKPGETLKPRMIESEEPDTSLQYIARPDQPLPTHKVSKPALLSPEIVSSLSTIEPDSSSPSGFVRVARDRFGKEVDRVPHTVAGLLPVQPRTTTSTDSFGNTRSSTVTGGGRVLPGQQPLTSPAPRSPNGEPSANKQVMSLADLMEQGTQEDWARIPQGARASVEQELKRRGAIILTRKQKEGIQTVERATGIVNTINDLSRSIHTNNPAPFAKWGSGLIEKGSQISTGNPQLAALEAGAASLGPMIRVMGEAGNLSEGDIARALAAVPVSPFLTRAEAEAKLNTLKDFINTARNAIQGVAGKTGNQLLNRPTGATPSGGTARPPRPAPEGMKWQQNIRTKEWRLAPIR